MFLSVGIEEVEESAIDSDILLKSNFDVETKVIEGQLISSSKQSSVKRSPTGRKCNALLRNKVQLHWCSVSCKS